MTRAELLDALFVEAHTPPPRPTLPTWTPAEQEYHRAVLLDALSSDPAVVAWNERRAG